MTDHPFGQVVIVVWHDAEFHDALPPEPVVRSTVGWIVESSASLLVIASELEGPHPGEDGARLYTTIPHGAVARVFHLNPGDSGGFGGGDDADDPAPTPPDTPNRLADFLQEPSCN